MTARTALFLLCALAFIHPRVEAAHSQAPPLPRLLVILVAPWAQVADEAAKRVAAELGVQNDVATVAIDAYGADDLQEAVVGRTATAHADGALVFSPPAWSQKAFAGAPGGALLLLSYDADNGTWQRRPINFDKAVDAGAVVAIQAAELLRAHFLLRKLAAREESVQRENALTVGARGDVHAAGVSPSRPLFAFEAALITHAAAEGAGGVAFAPTLRVGFLASQRWTLRLAGAPWTTANDFAGAEGKAEFRHAVYSVDAAFTGRVRAWTFYACAGVGLVQMQARGYATPPNNAITSTLTTAALRAGAGVQLHIAKGIAAVAEAGALVTAKEGVVQIAGQEQMRFGHPWLFAGVGLLLTSEVLR